MRSFLASAGACEPTAFRHVRMFTPVRGGCGDTMWRWRRILLINAGRCADVAPGSLRRRASPRIERIERALEIATRDVLKSPRAADSVRAARAERTIFRKVLTDGLHRRQLESHSALRDHRGVDESAPAQGRRARYHFAVGRRARLRHARQHQAGGGQGAGRGQDQVHRRRRHARAQGGDRRASSSARTISTTSPTRSRSAPAASR